MDQKTPPKTAKALEDVLGRETPYFDPQGLRALLSARVTESTDEGQMRADLLEQLKFVVAHARETARKCLDRTRDGRRCAHNLSLFQDELIRVIYDFAVGHVYRVAVPSTAERLAIVATGGYGRGLLAPGSDIDLLILLPYKQTAWGDSVVEFILYLLWDLNFKVGHAVRTVGQCIRAGISDMTIRTALIDSRFVWGDAELFQEFMDRFQRDVVKGREREFIAAKLDERDVRLKQSGISRYMVEPNVKDGKGGLRDLHTLHWLLRVIELAGGESATGLLSERETATFLKCEKFLWTVRCHLHFHAGRPEERLSFDVQPVLAEKLRYRDKKGLRAVERFMKHYFLIAKEVGDLTRIVCAVLEFKQLKETPVLNKLLRPLTWRQRSSVRKSSDFVIVNGRMNLAQKNAFKFNPVNLIRIFEVAEKNNVLFHPDVLRQIRASVSLIDDNVRNNKEANRVFLRMLTSRSSAETVLRNMNEAGVLGRFIPDFGRIVSMMQFNMYHHFTVDEHLIRSIGVVADIENGACSDLHPLSTEIIKTVENRRALYVATLLHDIAKGRDEDHSVAGAQVARQLCPRLGLTSAETDTVEWLVRHHLEMSHYAQSRDIGDPQTIRDFANLVQSLERLKLLLLLTVADIRAVGPGVWNGWKGELLRNLYNETEPLLSGGHTRVGYAHRVGHIKNALREALHDWPERDVERYLKRHYDSYWLRTDLETQRGHAELIRTAERDKVALSTHVATDAFTEMTEITIFAPNHPHLFEMVTGACAAAGGNIVGAQVSTTRDGMALDTLTLERDFDMAEDERRRAHRIIESVEKLLRGQIRLKDMIRPKFGQIKRISAFTVEPQVVIDNASSADLTVIEVNGLDRPGLLYDLTREMADMSLDVASAHVATFGEKAVDVFYVTDLMGKKITNKTRQDRIRRRLTKILEYEVERVNPTSDGPVERKSA